MERLQGLERSQSLKEDQGPEHALSAKQPQGPEQVQ